MSPHLRHILEQSIEMAVGFDYKMNRRFCMTSKNRCYAAWDESNPSCHPLETVVLGLAITDAINIDIAYNLGVSPQWVDGCVDAYSGRMAKEYLNLPKKDTLRLQYLQGYRDGKEIECWVEELYSHYHNR